LPAGQTAVIGQTGEIPVASGNIRSKHAQLAKLEDGTYELTDGFDASPSNKGIGEYGADVEGYGTYIRRVSTDGSITFEQVSATRPSIVRSGDEIFVGYNPERNLGHANTVRIVVPN